MLMKHRRFWFESKMALIGRSRQTFFQFLFSRVTHSKIPVRRQKFPN